MIKAIMLDVDGTLVSFETHKCCHPLLMPLGRS